MDGTRVTVEEAITELLGEQRSGDEETDLLEAVQASARIRERNTECGGAVLNALHDRLQSWREVERRTGIPRETARRWALPPTTDEPSGHPSHPDP